MPPPNESSVEEWTLEDHSGSEISGEVHDLRCADCDSLMELRRSKYGLFYGCSTYPKCSGTHGAHPDGRPLGKPATKRVREARIRAHQAFDKLWKEGHPFNTYFSRAGAYEWMREEMGLSEKEGHIASFDLVQCERLIDKVSVLLGGTPSVWAVLMSEPT